MYLNVRKPPLRSKIYLNPLAFFFPRPEEQQLKPTSTDSRSPPRSPRPRSSSTSLPIPSIPPATNPRGELIFSSRVDRSFRESYERYRATFERKREERERAAHARWWSLKVAFWRKTPPATVGGGSGSPTAPGAPALRTVSSSSSSRGKASGSRSGTPPSGGIVMRQRDRSGSPARQGTPTDRASGAPFMSPPRDRIKREGSSDVGMRTMALERSLNQGQHR